MSNCPEICHDEYKCQKKCGKKKCECVRNTRCDKEKSCKKWGPKKFPCDLPCSNKETIKILKVHVKHNENDCRPWADQATVYDPLAAFEKCAKPPCLHNLPPCDCECPAKKCPKKCEESSSSSSSSEECECHVVPARPLCEDCTEDCSCNHNRSHH